ncbi:MAG: carbon-nitrogen hydrolase family protein [Pseudomonadota bacterium]
MTDYKSFTMAAIQANPLYFDIHASTAKACALISEAGSKGADIAAFSETWLPGYPFFAWRQPSQSVAQKVFADYLANAIEIPGPETEQLCSAARDANLDVVIGVVERDAITRGTTYCTLLFISNEGEILGRHRKLKPTERERTVWGDGDGSGLNVYERPYGRISGLNCWEHNMVLPSYALIAQGTQIHVAAWPGTSTSRHAVLSAAFASQAASYVIDVGGLQSKDSIPKVYQDLYRPMPGESSIYDPFGDLMVGPAEGETILIAKGSTEKIYAAKTECDVAGHYSRPDIFQLYVNRNSVSRVAAMKPLGFENSHETPFDKDLN